MKTTRLVLGFIGIILLSIFLLAGLGLANYQYARVYPAGREFRIIRSSLQAFVFQGKSPYLIEAQTAGSQPTGKQDTEITSQDANFSLPLYSGFFLLPFALIKSDILAQAVWMLFSELSILLIVVTGLRLCNWNPGKPALFLLLIFSLLGFHGFQSLVLLNITVLTTLMVVLSFLAIRSNRDEVAGISLAVATVQPAAVLLVIIFLFLWAISNRRWRLLTWFAASLVFLVVIGIFFIPDWPLQYLRVLWHYLGNPLIYTPGRAFTHWWPGIGKQLGWILTAILSLLMLGEWISARNKNFRWFFWTACLTFVISQWIGIPAQPANLIILLVPLILVLGTWDQRLGTLGRWIGIVSLIVLWGGIWWIFLRFLSAGGEGLDFTVFLFPLPFFLILSLYWIRWWAIRPLRLYVEELKENVANQ